MAFRGRGRGRGRGGPYEFRMAKHEPFILFPEDVNLPSTEKFESLLPDEKELIHLKVGYERFMKESCYYLKESKREEEVENHELKGRRRHLNEHIGDYMKLNVSNFPDELIKGVFLSLHASTTKSRALEKCILGGKRGHVESKKIRWERNQDDFGFLEKLEEMHKDGEEKVDEKKKDDGVDEEEEKEEEEEEDNESSEDDDYAQNEYFDDDDDDFNAEEEPEEECYE